MIRTIAVVVPMIPADDPNPGDNICPYGHVCHMGTCVVFFQECVVMFDDAWSANGSGSDPTADYGPYGVDFDNTNGYGCIGGEGNGDPGN
jgi:hypothetical protein